jgi:hypothetical protein
MVNSKELAERARMFEERAEKATIRYPDNTTGKWLPTIERQPDDRSSYFGIDRGSRPSQSREPI